MTQEDSSSSSPSSEEECQSPLMGSPQMGSPSSPYEAGPAASSTSVAASPQATTSTDPASPRPNQPHRSPLQTPIHRAIARSFVPQTLDGVFFNMAAKPDAPKPARRNEETRPLQEASPSTENPNSTGQVVLPMPEDLPTYEEVADLSPPHYSETVYLATALSEVELDGIEVGSYSVFVMSVAISFVFKFIGFVMAFLLARSYAGKYGALGGLGLTLAMASLIATGTPPPASHHGGGPHGDPLVVSPLFALLVATIGCFAFIFSLFSYIRIRVYAQNYVRASLA